MTDAKLTGRQRYRVHKNMLVLQVEERGLMARYLCDLEWVTRWRDARVEDITSVQSS